MARDPVKRQLRRLQNVLRTRSAPGDRVSATQRIPDDIAQAHGQKAGAMLSLSSTEVAEMDRLEAELIADIRFEYLSHQNQAHEAALRFAGLATLDRRTDHASQFLSAHARTPEERACFITIESLSVTEERELFGITLLPPEHDSIPSMEPWSKRESPIGAVAVVHVRGTYLPLMTARARTTAEAALRVLRVGLVRRDWMRPEQLRFRLGEVYSFGDGLTGWGLSPEAAWPLELDDELLRFAVDSCAARLADGAGEIQRRGRLALKWIEHALFESDYLNGLLFLFFALEAIVGDTSEGVKAPRLAFRRAMLSFVSEGHFADPGRTYFLYESVRSAAVHGEDPPPVDQEMVSRLLWDVCGALNEYLAISGREDLKNRAEVRRFLSEHADAPRLAAWLRETDGALWKEFLDEQFPAS